jgi:benzoyl-CoA reductase/2-hydroxyglutaryl-CoA dehydratase subunit BcrC/BadD/HgdB
MSFSTSYNFCPVLRTQAQLAKLWGDKVTQQNISDAVKKLGMSRKKLER